eukprot:TRINITY_DN14363_c0_g1_i1.p1 TRINITY_DN14363_c0_g1~~TRINITY_DN14363_c0_g1_i1.p1  ORF type:complete len:376 (+),score=43.35 TRINITY_DN14363_c0_g1_i1:74-1129(+)
MSQPPILAYAIGGTMGDSSRMLRLMKAVYHPRNQYLLHLDKKAGVAELTNLTEGVSREPVYNQMENVYVVPNPNLVSYRGPTMVAWTLHAISILLQRHKDWDWFIQISAADYPLLPQDDILHVLSQFPRDLNFVEHNNQLGPKNIKPRQILMDPAIYSDKNAWLFFAATNRSTPTSFRLFGGSSWMLISREFCDYCIQGYDNLPRLLLMYFTNYLTSPEYYFQTTLCNSPNFKHTVVNTSLRYVDFGIPRTQHPKDITMETWDKITGQGLLFARKFLRDSDVMDRLDEEVLLRKPGFFVPGGWCAGSQNDAGVDPCNVVGDVTRLTPGPNAKYFHELATERLNNREQHQCV